MKSTLEPSIRITRKIGLGMTHRRKTSGYRNRNKKFAHMFYFALADTHPDTVKVFADLCVEYLSGYEGQIHFSIGERARQEQRSVNATDYDVAVNMIFENYAAYEHYRDHKRHQQFITEVAGMSTGRIVYDSFLEDDDQDESDS